MHGALFFFACTFIACEWRGSLLLQVLSIAVAVFVACSRLVDNRHFPSDIVAGGVWGAGVAYAVHAHMLRKYFNSSGPGTKQAEAFPE